VDENWPWLLLGDLNAGDVTEPINGMKSSWVTSDFNYGIDWLFYRPLTRWNWVDSRMIADADEALSDHEAVVSNVELINVNLTDTTTGIKEKFYTTPGFRVRVDYRSTVSISLAVYGNKEITSLELMDLKGNSLKHSRMELKNKQAILRVSVIHLRGIYFLKIKSSDKLHIIKKVL